MATQKRACPTEEGLSRRDLHATCRVYVRWRPALPKNRQRFSRAGDSRWVLHATLCIDSQRRKPPRCSSQPRYPLESSVWRTASGTLVSVKGPRVSILPFWAVQISESTRTPMIKTAAFRTCAPRVTERGYRAKVPTKALRLPCRSQEVPSPGPL